MVALNPATEIVHVQPFEVIAQAIFNKSAEPFALLPSREWIIAVSVFVSLKGSGKIPDQLIFVADICNWIRLDGLTLADLLAAFDRMNSVEVMAELDYGAEKFRTILARVVRDQIKYRRNAQKTQREREDQEAYDAQVKADNDARTELGLPPLRFNIADVFK